MSQQLTPLRRRLPTRTRPGSTRCTSFLLRPMKPKSTDWKLPSADSRNMDQQVRVLVVTGNLGDEVLSEGNSAAFRRSTFPARPDREDGTASTIRSGRC